MNNQEIQITAFDGGSFNAYVAKPTTDLAPGIIVIQEIFGVNEVMRDIAQEYARAGYLAIVPDLFWRQEPGISLTDKSEEEWSKAFELYKGFSEDKGVDDLIATLNALKELPGCNGKVGSVGFCLGGKLAYLMATRSNVECSVSYYGVAIENNLDEIPNIQQPLILHIAEEDQFVPVEAQNKIKTALSNHPLVTLHSYSKVNHAFARQGGEHYSKEAAVLANSRTLEFFRNILLDL